MGTEKIGARIREVRKRQKMTQGDLGKILGVSASSVSSYESGEYSAPPESLVRIAQAGGTTLDWLVAGIGSGPGEEKGAGQVIESAAVYSAGTDIDTWHTVIETVEEHLQEHNLQLRPTKKADLIVMLYEICMEEEGRAVDKKTVARLIKLAS